MDVVNLMEREKLLYNEREDLERLWSYMDLYGSPRNEVDKIRAEYEAKKKEHKEIRDRVADKLGTSESKCSIL